MRYAIVIVALLFAACNRQPATTKTEEDDLNVEKIKVDLLDTTKKYVEDIIETTDEVTLSADNYFRLSQLTNYFITDSAIIVVDRMQGVVFLFNRKGVLLNTITPSPDKKRVMDGRFTFINDGFYDSDEKLIELLDRTSDRVFRFTLTGAAKDTLKLGDARAWGHDFVKAGDTYVTKLNNGNEDRKALGVYKKDGKVLNYNAQLLSIIPSAKNLNMALVHQLDVYKSTVFFFPFLSDKIHQITDNKVILAYKLDYPQQYRLTAGVTDATPIKDPMEYIANLSKAKVIYNNNSLFINDDWVTFRFNFQSKTQPRNVFYNKKSKKVLQFTDLKSKTGKTLMPNARIIAKYKDQFVMLCDAPRKVNRDPRIQPKGNYKLMFFKLKDI
ncbi:MAG: 6-bladed beta-propeller [Bacteroidota bacterium]